MPPPQLLHELQLLQPVLQLLQVLHELQVLQQVVVQQVDGQQLFFLRRPASAVSGVRATAALAKATTIHILRSILHPPRANSVLRTMG